MARLRLRLHHFGLVVDDKEKVRRQLEQAGVKLLPGRGVEFRDPWGNRMQIVEYANIQFTKHQAVLDGMGCADLHKSREAIGTCQEGNGGQRNLSRSSRPSDAVAQTRTHSGWASRVALR